MQHFLSFHRLSVVKNDETVLAAHGDQPAIRRGGESLQAPTFHESNRLHFRPRDIAEYDLVARWARVYCNERPALVRKHHRRTVEPFTFQLRQDVPSVHLPDFQIPSLETADHQQPPVWTEFEWNWLLEIGFQIRAPRRFTQACDINSVRSIVPGNEELLPAIRDSFSTHVRAYDDFTQNLRCETLHLVDSQRIRLIVNAENVRWRKKCNLMGVKRGELNWNLCEVIETQDCSPLFLDIESERCTWGDFRGELHRGRQHAVPSS